MMQLEPSYGVLFGIFVAKMKLLRAALIIICYFSILRRKVLVRCVIMQNVSVSISYICVRQYARMVGGCAQKKSNYWQIG